MMSRLLPLALVFVAAAAHADGDFSRTLNVPGQPDLYVSTGSGNIRIRPGTSGHMEIHGHVHAGWSAFGDVGARVQHIVDSPPITQSGNAVHVGDIEDRSLMNNISIDYEIAVPPEAALNLHSGSGDLQTENVGRYLSGTTGSGSVRAHGVHGAAELQSGSGDIDLQELATGDVKARTGSGNIQIHGLNGGLTARTGSGDIQAEGHLANAATLSSGSGSVRLQLTPDSRFDLGASTGSGGIHVNFPGAPARSDETRHHVTGPVNGGGPPLEVRTGSGDIDISVRR